MFASDETKASGERSAVSGYCLGILEAGWLAAVLVVPLLFNPYSLRGYQFNKEAFLRILALMSLAALIVWFWEKARAANKGVLFESWKKNLPFTVSLLLLGLAYVVSTCLSVYPAASLWGSDQHQEGAFTFFCEIILFLSVIVGLRSMAQVERLVTSILVASIPVSLYAVMQRAGLDPVINDLADGRTPSTVGHPIYLGAYLTMVLPLCLWRMATLKPAFKSQAGKFSLKTLFFLFYAGIFVLELGGFFCAKSRGPLLAFAATALLLFVGWATHGKRKRVLIGGLALAGAAALGFIYLNLAAGSTKGLLANVGLARFTLILPVSGDPDAFRHQMWDQAPELMLATSPLPYPDGSSDSYHSLRFLFGYGPETLMNVLPHQYWWREARPEFGNRFHNLVWDTWSTIGFFGLIAFFLFVLLLFFRAGEELGLRTPARPRLFYGLTVLGCALAGGLVLGRWLSPGYIGLGGVVGLVSGLGFYWLLAYSLQKLESAACLLPADRACLLIALAAALAGHLIETSFAFTTPATTTLFWLYAGILLTLSGVSEPAEIKNDAREGKRETRGYSRHMPSKSTQEGSRRHLFWPALASGLIMVTLLSGFMFLYPVTELSTTDVLAATLTQTQQHETSYLIWLLLIPTAVAASFAFAAETFPKAKARGFDACFGLVLLFTGMIAVVFALLRAALIAGIGPLQPGAGPTFSAIGMGEGYQALYLIFIGLTVAFVWAGALILPSTPSAISRPWRPFLILGMAQVVALILAWWTCINPVRANMMARWALELRKYECAQQSTDVLRYAVSLTPGDTEYRRMLSDAYIIMSTKAPDPESMDSWLTRAEGELIESKKLTHELDPSDYELGQLYLQWATIQPSGEKQLEMAQKARAAFEQALVFEPAYEAIWTDRAAVDLLYLNDPQDAKMSQQKADEFIQGESLQNWGDFYRDRVEATPDPGLKQFYATHALDFYDRGIRDAWSDKLSAALYRMGKGSVDLAMNQPEQALNEYLSALQSAPEADTWDSELTLSRIYAQGGDQNQALIRLRKAIAMAPPKEQEYLRSLETSIRQPTH